MKQRKQATKKGHGERWESGSPSSAKNEALRNQQRMESDKSPANRNSACLLRVVHDARRLSAVAVRAVADTAKHDLTLANLINVTRLITCP